MCSFCERIHEEIISMTTNIASGATLAVAAIALAMGGLSATPAAAKKAAAVECMGINSCKGHSACKTASNACKGQRILARAMDGCQRSRRRRVRRRAAQSADLPRRRAGCFVRPSHYRAIEQGAKHG